MGLSTAVYCTGLWLGDRGVYILTGVVMMLLQ